MKAVKDAPKPTFFRRIERWLVGVIMGILAFGIEKAVLRSIRKGGGETPKSAIDDRVITSKGNEISA